MGGDVGGDVHGRTYGSAGAGAGGVKDSIEEEEYKKKVSHPPHNSSHVRFSMIRCVPHECLISSSQSLFKDANDNALLFSIFP